MANYNLGSMLGAAAAQNTITLQGASGSSSSAWSGQTITISDLDFGHGAHVKKYQILEIEEDLLALSCVWQRLRDTTRKTGNYVSISKITDSELFARLTEEDHQKAARIRDYYSKKIMLWKLKGNALSKFREDMNEFIHSTGKMFKEEMCPLVYRLPEFYDYDVAFDDLTNEFNKKVSQEPRNQTSTKQISLAKTFVVGKKYSKRKEYWFNDENNDLVLMSFMYDNPLIPLLDSFSKKPFTLEAIYTKKYRDNVEYLEANKFKFI